MNVLSATGCPFRNSWVKENYFQNDWQLFMTIRHHLYLIYLFHLIFTVNIVRKNLLNSKTSTGKWLSFPQHKICLSMKKYMHKSSFLRLFWKSMIINLSWTSILACKGLWYWFKLTLSSLLGKFDNFVLSATVNNNH